jgi:hypothetical protein
VSVGGALATARQTHSSEDFPFRLSIIGSSEGSKNYQQQK